MIQRNNYINKISSFIGAPVVKVITGLRRTGKSTLLKLLIEQIRNEIPNAEVLYINMELLSNRNIRNADDLYSVVKQQYEKAGRKKIFLFIDEIQQIAEWEKAVASFLAEDWADIYITGSNASLLASDLATLLTGRYIDFPVYGLTYKEYLRFTGEDNTDEAFYRFMSFGGFPGIHHSPLDDELVYQYVKSIYDTIILRDVVTKNNVRNISLLERLVHYLFDITGSIFSGRNVSNYFKKESRTVSMGTVYDYVKYLEEAFCFYRVSRYDIRGKRKLEVAEKYYPGDIGLQNALLGFNDSMVPGLLESIVFLDLKMRGYTVYIGKWDDREIDFIAEKQNSKLYLQVCYLLMDESVRNREFSPLQAIPDNFPKYVLSMDKTPPGDYEGIKRFYLPDFLLRGDDEL